MDSNHNIQNGRILIADDEPSILDLFRRVLSGSPRVRKQPESTLTSSEFESMCLEQDAVEVESAGHQLVFCRQGETAVELVRVSRDEQRPFAIAFLDIRMPPGQSGVATAEQIRQLDPDVHFVFVTAYSDVHPFEMSQLAPPSDKIFYVPKPFQTEEIQQVAEALCTKWNAEHHLHSTLNSMVDETGRLAVELSQEKTEFDTFKGLVSGREKRMVELKLEIDKLLEQLGKPKRFNP